MFKTKRKCKNMNMERIKVLHLTELGAGGIAKLTVTINKFLSDKIQFDYLVFRDRKEFLEDEALSYGGKKQIIDTENIHNTLLKVIWKEVEMIKLFKKEQYDFVHVDASTPYDVVVAIAAKLAGIKRIVLHSHNDNFHGTKPLRDFFMPLYKWCMLFVVTDYITISESAANFMFPKKILKEKKYHFVHNGIDVDKYIYSDEDRKKYRQELNLEDKFVLGNVGRFDYQKNHDFIVDVFEEIHKKQTDSILLLAGKGDLENSIKEKLKKKNLLDYVIFYGITHDVRKVLLMMDAFIFSSRFEGLGIVGIEAQTTGLLTFCADTIVEEVNVTDCFKRIHGWNACEWANVILNTCKEQNSRLDMRKSITDSGYNVREVAAWLEAFYLK